MRVLLLCLVTGCAATLNGGKPRPSVLRDVEGYAIASCLAHQNDDYLMEQGSGWASVIIQRGDGGIGAFAAVSEKVQAELSRSEMAVVRVESPSGASDRPLPILYCSEIIDRPSVRMAIKKAVADLASGYEE